MHMAARKRKTYVLCKWIFGCSLSVAFLPPVTGFLGVVVIPVFFREMPQTLVGLFSDFAIIGFSLLLISGAISVVLAFRLVIRILDWIFEDQKKPEYL